MMKKRSMVLFSLMVLMSMTSIQTVQAEEPGGFSPEAKFVSEVPTSDFVVPDEDTPIPQGDTVEVIVEDTFPEEDTVEAPILTTPTSLNMDEIPECAEELVEEDVTFKETFSVTDGKVVLFEEIGDEVYYVTPVGYLEPEAYCLGEVIRWAGLFIDWNVDFIENLSLSCTYFAQNGDDYVGAEVPGEIFLVYAYPTGYSIEDTAQDYVLWYMIYDIEGEISCGSPKTHGVDTGRMEP